MTTKALSRCCTAKARVNVRDGGYFCDACGKDCGTKQEASGFGACLASARGKCRIACVGGSAFRISGQ